MATRPIPIREALRLGSLAGPRWLAAHLALSFVQGLLPLAGIWAMKLLVDAVAGLGGDQVADREAARDRVLEAVAIALGIALLGSALRALGSYVGDAHGRLVADRAADRMICRSASLDLLQVEDPKVLDLMQRAGQEVSSRPGRILSDLTGGLLALVTLASMGALLALVDPVVTVVVAVAAIPAAVIRLKHARKMFAWQRETAEAQREIGYLSTLASSRASAKDLRAFGIGATFTSRVREGRDVLRRGALQLSAGRSRGQWIGESIGALALFFAYARLGWLALDGVFGIGAFVMYAQAVQRTQTGVQSLLGSSAALSEHRLFLSTFVEFEALQPQVEERLAPATATAAEPREVGTPERLEFRDVGFAYPDGRPVLGGLEFAIEPGERVALVGPNGSGKSTIVRLLARLSDPAAGAITYGGHDLRERSPTEWREHVAVLFQDAAPFEFRACENIDPAALGQADLADQPSVREAARQAGVLERLEALPSGLSTRMGRRFSGGRELSAGEWRRLLLARALYRQSDLLVLDEPGAFLDAAACRALGQELSRSSRSRTILVVDHRVDVVSWVDRVLVLEEGRVVQSGSPEELAAIQGPFRRLFRGR